MVYAMRLLAVFIIGVLVLLSGCASRTTGTPVSTKMVSVQPAASTGMAPAAMNQPAREQYIYRIGPHDLLAIEVFGVEELSRKVRVNSKGQITLPLIGVVQAGGLSNEQLERHLAELLARDFLQDPQVSVFIEEFTSQRVTVEGQVKKPGVYPIQGRTTLLQSIAMAEGLGEYADGDDIVIFRQTNDNGQRMALQYQLDAIRGGQVPDPVVRGDDVVVVGKSAIKEVASTFSKLFRGFISPIPIFR